MVVGHHAGGVEDHASALGSEGHTVKEDSVDL
jgi:hypothetical protein